MAGEEKWIFTPSQLANTPSRRCGIDSDKELNYRQQLANFIQDMGQKLQVTQLCINTAIVYMHRFYMYHSFTAFNKHSMASACVFLAAKVEEQPRKLEHVIRVVHMCLHRDTTPPDTKSEAYLKEAQELVINENILLQSLGFEITVDHPHTHVVKTCQLVRASKDLAQTSYFLATNSLHLTTMCLQYKPTVVSCVCIHLACKWSSWEIPRSSEDKEWFVYTDRSVTSELLEELTQNFLNILEKCPSKLKKKIMTWKEEAGKKSSAPGAGPVTSAPQEVRQKPSHTESRAPPPPPPPPQAGSAGHTSSSSNRHEKLQTSISEPGMRRVKTEPNLSSLTPQEYRERKERERAILNAQHAILKPSTMSERERHHLDALAAPAAHPERPRDSHRDHKSAHHHPHRTGDRTQLPRSHADPTQHRHEIHKPGHDPPFKDGRMDVEARSRDAHSNREQNMINRDSHHGHTEGKKSREQLQSQAAPPPPPAPVKAEAPPESERSKVRDMHRTHVNLLPAKDENPLLDLFKENKVSMEPLPAAEMLMAELAKPVVDPVDDPIKVEPRAPPRQTSMVSLAAEAAKTEVAAVKQETTVKQEIKSEVKQETALKESSATSSPALTGSQESPKLPKISFAQLRERKHAEALKLASEHPSPKKSKRDRTDRTDSGEKKDLKLKIVNLGGSPGVASVKRQDESRSSPHGTGDLKLKLDLKAHRRHEHRSERSRSSDPASADAAVHRSSSSSSSTSNPPLKLKLKLGPGSSGSPSTSSSHREHRHHHHRHSSHHSNGSHSSRKRGHNSPASNTPASKMPRNDSIPNSATITNGNDSESPAVKIDALTRQLQMLIDAQKSQLQHQGAKQPDGMPPLPPVGLQLPAVPPPPPPPE